MGGFWNDRLRNMDSEKRPIYINITAMGVVKVILIFILFYLLFLIKDILAILFVSLVLASAFDPWVDWMQKKRIPRGLGIIIIYLILFLVVAAVISLLIPPIVNQTTELMQDFPKVIEKVVSSFSSFKLYAEEHGFLNNVKDYFGSLSSNIQGATSGIFSTVTGVIGGIFTFFLILVITFYMVVQENALKKIIYSVVPEKHQVYTMHLINRMQIKIGLWLRGQLILSLIIFMLTFIALTIVNMITGKMEFALVLALLAGLTEFVPYLGPTIAAIPAIFLAFTVSPMMAITIAVLYYIIQLVENNIIAPKLMQKVVGLNPIVSIAVLLIGFKLGGIMGAILSIPVATAIAVFIKDLFEQKAINPDLE